MSTLDELKNELVKQKTLIETKGGSVSVANTNPSPSEITSGINTINVPNLSLATATESDVLTGKTFYAIDSTLKTGTFDGVDFNTIFDCFCGFLNETSPVHIAIPNGISKIRPYLFYMTTRPLIITLNSDLEILSEFAFNNGDITITNLHEMEHITQVLTLSCGKVKGIDLACLPTTITFLSSQCFYEVVSTSYKIVFPPNVTTCYNNVFSFDSSKQYYDDLDITNLKLSAIPTGLVQNIVFDCDLSFPSCVNEIGIKFNYGGSFKNVTLHAGINNIKAYAFGSLSSDPEEIFTAQHFTFLGETPPTFGTGWLAEQYLNSNFHIYVPDNAVEAYKSALNSKYQPYVAPMSQKSS